MKKIVTVFIFLLVSFGVFSQPAYEQAMRDGLDSLKQIKELQDFQKAANHFERIAATEPGQWLPRYYAGYCRIVLSFKEQEKEKKEQLLLKSESLLNEALKINPGESELFTLQGMLFQGFIILDPQNNAREYSAKANLSFEKAMALNTSNPRPYYLKGMNLMYTPEAYGGGMKAAYPLFVKAKELFETFVKANELMPDWGKDQNEQFLGKIAVN